MNKTTGFLLIVTTVLAFSLGATMQGRAQDKSFAGVVPFITSNDRVGFFSQSNGKIYMYDSNINQCLFIGQMQSLGQPIIMVPATPAVTATNQ